MPIKRRISIIVLLAFSFLPVLTIGSFVCADTITNVRYYHVSDDRIVIYYDLDGIETSDISVEASWDGGKSFGVKTITLSGDAGNNVSAGTNKRIVCKLEKGVEQLPDDFRIKVLANNISETVPLDNYEENNSITAYYINSPINIDGLLTESFWEIATPATGFTQREPIEGTPATEKTEVKILYDNEKLYIGIICYDKEPDKIIHNELKVDGFLTNDDNFSMIIDTFNDKRGGYYFCVNPNGAREDGTIGRKQSGSGEGINNNWNGIWDTSARITEYGWSAEIYIPFKTLKFGSGEIQTWGINFRRGIVRKNEEVLWCSWGRDDGLLQLSKTGSLVNLKNIERGKHIEFKPYMLGGLEEDQGVRDEKLKYGLDIKYPLTSQLTLDLTTFTDFAQVEADRTMINLTRFSLHYPEKRDFFLEGSEIFAFGQPDRATPFYSRQIGITPEREQVPILAGAKVTGKAGGYNLGIINMQTDDQSGYLSTNYSVVRIKKDVFEKSYIGIIATNFYNTDKQSQAVGVDFSYRTDKFLSNKNLRIEGLLTGNYTPGIHGNNQYGQFSITYPNDLLSIHLLHRVIGENFKPEIGYVDRVGIKKYILRPTFSPRPNIPFVRKLMFNPFSVEYTADINNKLLTREMWFMPFGLQTTTDDQIRFEIYNWYEYLDEDFNIFNDMLIPKGIYDWWNYRITFRGNDSRPVSLNVRSDFGNFYNGKRTMLNSGVNFKLNKHFSFSTDINYNKLSFASKSFSTKEYSLRLNSNVSTRLTSRTYIQWNNEDKITNMNFQIHYIPQIGSDIYFVYNHLWDGYQDYKTLYKTSIAKIAYQITF